MPSPSRKKKDASPARSACIANTEVEDLFSRSCQMPSEPPSWFTAAIDQTPDHCDVEVDGCRIHLRVWGDEEQPPVVLVHGGGAHSGWWDHIAPFFSRTHRVIAHDLSGHGDRHH